MYTHLHYNRTFDKINHNTFSQEYPKKYPVHYIQAYIYQFMQFQNDICITVPIVWKKIHFLSCLANDLE